MKDLKDFLQFVMSFGAVVFVFIVILILVP